MLGWLITWLVQRKHTRETAKLVTQEDIDQARREDRIVYALGLGLVLVLVVFAILSEFGV